MKRNALILFFTLATLMCGKFVHGYLVTCFDPYHIEQDAFVKVQESIFLTPVDMAAYEVDQIIWSVQDAERRIHVLQNVGPAMNTMRSKLEAEHENFTLMSLGRHKMVLGLRLWHKSLPIQLVMFPSWDDVSDVRDVRWIWKHIGLRILDVNERGECYSKIKVPSGKECQAPVIECR